MKIKQTEEKDEECKENLGNIPIDDKTRVERLCGEKETGDITKFSIENLSEMVKTPQQIDELSKLLCKINHGKSSGSPNPLEIEKCPQVLSNRIKDLDPTEHDTLIKEMLSRSESITLEELENLPILSPRVRKEIPRPESKIGQVEGEEELELIDNQVYSIDPIDIPDEKERKALENKFRTIFKTSWEQFTDPRLDSQTCEINTKDIPDKEIREQLLQKCNTEMNLKTRDPKWKIQSIYKFREFFQVKIKPMIIYFQTNIEDPNEKEENITDYLEREIKLFSQKLSNEKLSSLNPADKEIKEAKKRKPSGYLKSWDNLVKELKPIIERLGHFPTKDELEGVGRSNIEHAITRYHGGRIAVAKKMGYEPSYGYLKSWDNLVKELEPIIKKLGHFPIQDELDDMGRIDLEHAITRYHGGMIAVAERMGYKPRYGYLKCWNNLVKELEPIIKKLGHFPTQDELEDMGRSGIERAITIYYGGMIVVAKKMGYAQPESAEIVHYSISKGQKAQEDIINILKAYADQIGYSYSEGRQVGPHRFLELVCGEGNIIGVDVTATHQKRNVEAKWKVRQYHRYVGTLWVIVVSDK